MNLLQTHESRAKATKPWREIVSPYGRATAFLFSLPPSLNDQRLTQKKNGSLLSNRLHIKSPFAPLRVCFCLLIYTALADTAKAQEERMNFTSLTMKDGLSSSSVNAIIKDRYGVMWFGTDDGLDKFDGLHVTVYRQKRGDSTALPANEILSLHEDKAGNLWVGTSGGSLCRYDRTRDAFVNLPPHTATAFEDNVIRSLWSDYLGKIWVGHFGGLHILDPENNQVSRFSLLSKSNNTAGACNAVFEDSRRQMWIGTDSGLFCYNPQTRQTTRFLHATEDPESINDNHVNAVTEDRRGNVWIGTQTGLSQLKPGTNRFANYGGSLKGVNVTALAADGERLWLGTAEGLDILDARTGKTSNYRLDYRNSHSLSANTIHAVYVAPEGICWLGTFRGGVSKYDRNLNLFHYVQSNVLDKDGLHGSIVTAFAEDKNGNVYVGTEGPGLSLFDRKSQLFRHVSLPPKRAVNKEQLLVLAVLMSRRQALLVGTFGDGLYWYNPATGSYRQQRQGASAEDLNANEIFSITEARNGEIWVGTNGQGINVLHADGRVIRRYTPNPEWPNDVKLPINGFIRDIEEDRDGNVWIATHGGGLAVLQPASGKFTRYYTGNSGLPNDKIYSLAEDNEGNMWIGTMGGGLSVFNKATRQFTNFTEKDGLPNSSIYKILVDNQGLIWVSTNAGISSLDPHTGKINNYTAHNGVQNNSFVRGSGLRLSTGELFFGGLEGFNYFNPANPKKNNNIPSVLLTDLRISNRSVLPSADGPLPENISVAKEINLGYKQNFALGFVGLSYTSPEQNQYAYKLEGFDKDWNYVGNSTNAAYTNIDPGEYVFRVKAGNNDGVWNEQGKSIRIVVRPPFWRTGYAYVFYALVIIGGLFFVRRRGIQKLERRFAREQERTEAERLRELDRLKIKFLTNLSHEFRTPISLILGPADNLLREEKSERAVRHLQLIKRNGRRLLNLVNQLLDFRKMEEQELKLHPQEGELISFVREVCDSFNDLSERKQIAFRFTSAVEKFYTQFDCDKVERILFNLLSNAFKFTMQGGQIQLAVEKENRPADNSQTWMILKVSDTGIGIPADKKEKIFERFFQNTTATSILNQGTGIGLSITKEFVRMHGGEINVESVQGQGTTFIIRLPFTPTDTRSENTAPVLQTTAHCANEDTATAVVATEEEKVAVNKESESPAVLLVEDDDDFRFYLKDNLRHHFTVLEAANGKEGWQKALANHPQLIVSDISMPYMDGIELCRKIKSDRRTGHIPLILLTALTGEEDQLKGLGTGANDYITKPFNVDVLNAKIKNLLLLNSTLKNAYSKRIEVIAAEIETESEDEKLLKTVALYLEENLTNSQLSVEEVSRHVGMSRSSLYAKLLQITGQTPVEFIRSFKLEKAAALLEKSDMHIAQIAYSVGFATPNYFAKSFKAKYGLLPSEYLARKRQNKGRENRKD